MRAKLYRHGQCVSLFEYFKKKYSDDQILKYKHYIKAYIIWSVFIKNSLFSQVLKLTVLGLKRY